MVKKTLLILLFSANLYAGSEALHCGCNSQYNELSTTKKVILYGTATGTIGVGIVVAAPFVLPAGVVTAVTATLASAKVAAVAGATKIAAVIIPTTPMGYVASGLQVAQWVRPCIIQTIEEKLNSLKRKKALKLYKAEVEFISCLKQNKIDSLKNAAGRPTVCEDAALFYAFVAGNAELNRRTEAFNNKKCFCY